MQVKTIINVLFSIFDPNLEKISMIDNETYFDQSPIVRNQPKGWSCNLSIVTLSALECL